MILQFRHFNTHFIRTTLTFSFAEDVVPLQPKAVPNGTYVIRKGRERKHVFDIPEFAPPLADAKAHELRDADDAAARAAVAEIESVLESSQELLLSIEEPNDDIPQPPINIPKYRHSIDLAMPSMQSSIHSTKYALLHFEIFQYIKLASFKVRCHSNLATSNFNLIVKIRSVSFRYRHPEYNSFWPKPNDAQLKHAQSLTPSKHDYAKENKGGSSNKIDVNDDLNAPLMRVASLPIINAPPPPVANQGKADFLFSSVLFYVRFSIKFFGTFSFIRKGSI